MLSVLSLIDKAKKNAEKHLIVAFIVLIIIYYIGSTGTSMEVSLLDAVFSTGLCICIYYFAKQAVKVYYLGKEKPKYYAMKNVLKEQDIYKSLRADWLDDLRKGTNTLFAFIIGCIAVFALSLLAPDHPAIWEHLFQIKILTYLIGVWAAYIGGKQGVRKNIDDFILNNSLNLAEEKSCVIIEDELENL